MDRHGVLTDTVAKALRAPSILPHEQPGIGWLLLTFTASQYVETAIVFRENL
jgi:hypothetical protein